MTARQARIQSEPLDATVRSTGALDLWICGTRAECTVKRLVTKVPTIWGSEYNCLERHEMLRKAIDDLTSTPRYSCNAYYFSDADWKQLAGLKNILNVRRPINTVAEELTHPV